MKRRNAIRAVGAAATLGVLADTGATAWCYEHCSERCGSDCTEWCYANCGGCSCSDDPDP